MNPELPLEPTIVRLQSDQFIVKPLAEHRQVAMESSSEYDVDLIRQSCQCKDYTKHRKPLAIGDPRRLCRHLVDARCQFLDDLPPFLQAILQARNANNAGMPNGAAFAFFEIDGRLSFFGDHRDRTTYFFLTGQDRRCFYEYVYDRKSKTWSDGRIPPASDRLVKFAFKTRSQYGVSDTSGNSKSQSRSRSAKRAEANRGEAQPLKYFSFLVVAAILVAVGFFVFKDGPPKWLGELSREGAGGLAAEPENKPSQEEMLEALKQQKKPSLPPTESLIPSQDLESETEDSDPNETIGTDLLESQSLEANEVGEDGQPNAAPKLTPEYRSWKTIDNQFSVIARYVSYQNGTVTLEREDNQARIKIDESELSAEDQAYVKQIKRERRLQKARERKKN